ncbi:MAG: transglutaminase-like domain-containing protein [Actinomycetota bacterium]|nr:transglutaminase-like domain-containing protein [Actinomycetota bacterium]
MEIEGEEYSPDIAAITSMGEFEDRIRHEIQENALSGLDIPILVDDYVRNKFFNHESLIAWNHNWVLAAMDSLILGRLFPTLFITHNMKPDDIIRFDHGLCNQQAIVFQKIMSNLGFEYGSVRFSSTDFGHFASAVKVNGRWYFFDPNLEPEYDRRDPQLFDQILLGDRALLTQMYGNYFDSISSELIQLGDINTFPASRGALVQTMSFFLSWYGWALFLVPNAAILLRRSGARYLKTRQSGSQSPQTNRTDTK